MKYKTEQSEARDLHLLVVSFLEQVVSRGAAPNLDVFKECWSALNFSHILTVSENVFFPV